MMTKSKQNKLMKKSLTVFVEVLSSHLVHTGKNHYAVRGLTQLNLMKFVVKF